MCVVMIVVAIGSKSSTMSLNRHNVHQATVTNTCNL